MKSIKILSLTAILMVAFSFTSCKSKTENSNAAVSTDLVNNPATAEGNVDAENIPVMELEKENHEFGKITEGEKVSYSFKFKNSGKADLIISDAKGSCGCTVPDYPKEPIAPGASGEINVMYKPGGQQGNQSKTVTVTANTEPAQTVLNISADVQVDPNAPKVDATGH